MKYSGSEAGPRHEDKVNKVLSWVLRHSVIDVQTVQLLLNVSYSTACDTIQNMAQGGLLAPMIGHGVSCPLFRLTPAGARLADRTRGEFDEGLKALTNPSEIGVHYASHNQVVARYAARWLADRGYDGDVLSPRQIRLHNFQIGDSTEHKAARKVPDALLLQPVSEDLRDCYELPYLKIAVEVQQTDEGHETRAYKLWQYFRALRAGQINYFEYVSSREHIVNAYHNQWLTELEERTYWVDRHRWTRPSNPEKVDRDDPLLDYGTFEVLPHDPFAKGLYPSPASMNKYIKTRG